MKKFEGLVLAGEIDSMCIEFCRFFNSVGLETSMCCEGHNNKNLYSYWISFSKNVKDEDIANFISNFEQPYYAKNKVKGKFIKINFGFKDNGEIDESWRYICNNYTDYKMNQYYAMEDLKIFKRRIIV